MNTIPAYDTDNTPTDKATVLELINRRLTDPTERAQVTNMLGLA